MLDDQIPYNTISRTIIVTEFGSSIWNKLLLKEEDVIQVHHRWLYLGLSAWKLCKFARVGEERNYPAHENDYKYYIVFHAIKLIGIPLAVL